MARGRPRGSVKAKTRQRRDYRFSPATMQLIEQGRQITGKTETAFVEAAIQRYHEILLGGDDTSEVERLRARVQRLEEELAPVAFSASFSDHTKDSYSVAGRGCFFIIGTPAHLSDLYAA